MNHSTDGFTHRHMHYTTKLHFKPFGIFKLLVRRVTKMPEMTKTDGPHEMVSGEEFAKFPTTAACEYIDEAGVRGARCELRRLP